MTRFFSFLIIMLVVAVSSTEKEPNPLLSGFQTPFGVPPFEQIRDEHYMPAFKEAMRIHDEEIKAITHNEQPATFDNTIVQMERSGRLLSQVRNVFFNLKSANTNEALQAIAKDVTPLLSAHNDNILLNEKLFERVKTVYNQKQELPLTGEQTMLLEKYYKDFVRSGAALASGQKETLRSINEELSMLSLKFGDNILAENNRFELVIESEADLSGLPESAVNAASETAARRNHPGKWVFTLHKPSLIPFLTYSDRRDLREKMFKAYINRGDNGDDLDTKELLLKMADLRIRRANLLGYKTHAEYVLEENMARKPENVYAFLDDLWKPALANAGKEAYELQAIIDREGTGFKLEAWDWWYYAEKLKKEKYALDDNLLRPYFKLENVRDGAFDVAHKLFGITFHENPDLPKYHEEVTGFEVRDADGSHIGILYTDYFPRESKRGGAWMNSFRKQYNLDGEYVTPVVYNVCNFPRPAGDKPSLLSLDDVETLFHEFGHALHGLLSRGHYPKLTGTSVPRDFVELPSQIMENWANHPDVLKEYARHYQTGDPIPEDLVKKISRSGLFNQGFATVEYLAASYLDMDWHTLSGTEGLDVTEFENASLSGIGLIPEIVVRYRSPYFSHIFAGGYSSGYYSYIWAEVLDADAFHAFEETSLFNPDMAASFRKNILAAGGSEDPMVLYKRFRGKEPDKEPLLRRRGLN